jgi:enamine deaminase RidA (YjgF/YER057c/UK114 family)
VTPPGGDSPEARLAAAVAELGHDFSGPLKIGGDYLPAVRHGGLVFVSGQIPRVGDAVVVTGRAGAETPLPEAHRAAAVCAMRALAVLRHSLGSLECVAQLLRVTVYVQSAGHFTQQSEVADGASALLRAVLGPAGAHARTSVGVFRLPKDATVELDLVAAVRD